MTGLSNNHISNIENKHSISSIEALMKIAIALDTSPDYFLLGTAKFGEDESFEVITQKIKLCDEKQKDLLNSFLDWLVGHKL